MADGSGGGVMGDGDGDGVGVGGMTPDVSGVAVGSVDGGNTAVGEHVLVAGAYTCAGVHTRRASQSAVAGLKMLR